MENEPKSARFLDFVKINGLPSQKEYKKVHLRMKNLFLLTFVGNVEDLLSWSFWNDIVLVNEVL